MNFKHFFTFSFDNPVWWIITFILFYLILNPLYYYFTRFNKTITVKKVYDYAKGRYGRGLMFEDTDSNIYKVSDLWFKGEYDSMEDWNKLSVGSSFQIEGYGKRIPIFSRYPSVYKINKVEGFFVSRQQLNLRNQKSLDQEMQKEIELVNKLNNNKQHQSRLQRNDPKLNGLKTDETKLIKNLNDTQKKIKDLKGRLGLK